MLILVLLNDLELIEEVEVVVEKLVRENDEEELSVVDLEVVAVEEDDFVLSVFEEIVLCVEELLDDMEEVVL